MPKNPSFQDVNDLFNRFHGEIEALIEFLKGEPQQHFIEYE